MPFVRQEIPQGQFDGFMEPGSAGEPENQVREESGGKLPAAMPMGHRSAGLSAFEGMLSRLLAIAPFRNRDIKPGRSCPHDSSASFRGIVGRPSVRIRDTAFQGRDTGVSRRSPRPQFRDPHEEAILVLSQAWPLDSLGGEPAQVGAVGHAGEMPDAPERGAHMGAQDGFYREEGHLGIVGDRADPPIRLGEILDPFFPKAGLDGSQAKEFDRGAQRVADGAAKEATPEAACALRGDVPQRTARWPDMFMHRFAGANVVFLLSGLYGSLPRGPDSGHRFFRRKPKLHEEPRRDEA